MYTILDTTTIRRVLRKPDCIRLRTLVKPKGQNSKEWYDFRHRHCETTKLGSPNPEHRYALGVSRNSVQNILQLPGTCFEDIDSNISVHTKQQIISTYQISKHHAFLIETANKLLSSQTAIRTQHQHTLCRQKLYIYIYIFISINLLKSKHYPVWSHTQTLTAALLTDPKTLSQWNPDFVGIPITSQFHQQIQSRWPSPIHKPSAIVTPFH